ncbi:hypothetical protein DFP72DRAFT_932326 [Ephemerocybe angulata]|uniref:Protein kinase domain-containing protein n=1 Tax=Ephemerocybe angulata TaxID=980116 RepID=A0A8H6HCD3_9AGAR|nr:hypothetical protein DFP72DRAFT_932326 [Tulosesus angulatus]
MSLRLTCCYPADLPAAFSVKIKKEVLIDVLANKVRKRLKKLGMKVLLTDVRLYKTDIDIKPEEDLKKRACQFLHEHQEEALSWLGNVGEFFPDAPITQVHVLVVTPEVMEYLEIIDNPKANYARKIRKDLDKKVKELLSKSSQREIIYSLSRLDAFFAESVYRNQVPAALFNGALGRLQQCLSEKNDVIPHERAVQTAGIYIARATETYNDEQARQDAMMPIVEEVLGRATEWHGDLEPGACWFSNDFVSMILEMKHVPGINGDPIFQCLADLSKIISSPKYDTFRGSCNFPVVLIGLAGSRIHVSVAVYLGALFVSDLLTLDLSGGFHGGPTTILLARIFNALYSCCEELDGYYNGVCPSSRFDASFLYPHPIAADDSPLPVIQYDKYIGLDGSPTETVPDLGERCTAIYTGFVDEDKPVVIKFTQCYNKEAHTLLAKAGLAPQLYFCNHIVGDILMVVMEYMPRATSVRQLTQGHHRPRLPPVILKEVKHAVKLLHDAGIVFGDLRDGNILYSMDQQTGEEHVVLVDFDWPGVAGESRYSATLNINAEWAPGVDQYSVMEKEHDLWHIECLEGLITTVS